MSHNRNMLALVGACALLTAAGCGAGVTPEAAWRSPRPPRQPLPPAQT